MSPPGQRPRLCRAKVFHLGHKADFVLRILVTLGALTPLVLLALLILVLTYMAWPAIIKFNWHFLVSTHWNPVPGFDHYGVLQFAYGTLASSFIALLLAVPISIGTAVFIVRIAPRWLGGIVAFLVELLAAIPSIAYGLWGALVMVPWLQDYGEPALKHLLKHIKLIPLGHSEFSRRMIYFPANLVRGGTYGSDMLAGGLILAIMITPIITAITRDVLLAVPPELEEGSYALGATWWQATRLVLHFARSGILGAVILGMARAIGETMAVIMVIGNTDQIKGSLFAGAQTMAGLIANEFMEASHPIYRQSVVYVALVLVFLSLVLNGAARWLVQQTTNQKPKSKRKRVPRAQPPVRAAIGATSPDEVNRAATEASR